jgi:sugar lactone lactonase YvrE
MHRYGRIQPEEAENISESPGRKGRRSLFAILGMSVVLLSAVLAATAVAQGGEGGERPEFPELTPQLIGEANESPTVSMEAPAPDLAAARQLPHAELGRTEALDLLESVFAPVVEQPAGIFDEMPTARFVSDDAAVMQLSPEGAGAGPTEEEGGEAARPVLVESSVPLRVEDESGRDAPVDLSLEEADGEVRPSNPLVATSLPTELHEGIELAEGAVTIGFPEAAPERAPSIVDEDSAFYPSVRKDTDLLVTPNPTGVETLTELRTAQAPKTEIQTLSLEEGVTLKATDEGGAEAVFNGRTVLEVAPPTATDAAGNSVPVQLSVAGDAIELAVSPPESAAYPILVDPSYVLESTNWAVEGKPFLAWEPSDSAPGYLALTQQWPTQIPALDLTSGFPGGASQNTGAQWYYPVPRYWSDQVTYHEFPHSYISFVDLSSAMFLTEGNNAYYPEEVDGILDPVANQGWIAVGSYNGTQGQFSGWSGNFRFPPEPSFNENEDGKLFVFGLITIEPEAQAKYRNAVTGAVAVGLSDNTKPALASLGSPGGWWNTGEPTVTFDAVDAGLGISRLKMGPEEQAVREELEFPQRCRVLESRRQPCTPLTEAKVPCTGATASPCPRELRSGEDGLTLPLHPAAAPEGIDHYEVVAESPLHVSTVETVPLRVDHGPPTLALSGTATEQGTLGTAKPQYTLKYSAADGTREPPTMRQERGAANPAATLAFKEPADVTVAPDESVWVADTGNGQIDHLTLNGEPLANFKVENEALSSPKGIASDANGNIWVSDTGHNRLVEFNPSGVWIRKVGKAGTGNGEFSVPQGVAVAPNGNVWVADTGNNRVQELTSAGAFVGAFEAATSPTGPLHAPQGIAVAPNGNVWVADTGDNRIVELSSTGKYLATFGSLGSGQGQFNKPIGIDVDNKGNVTVIDKGNSRVEQLSERGEYLDAFGTGTTFGASAGVAALPAGGIWVTASGTNRLQEWSAPVGTRSGVRSVTVKMDGKVLEKPEVTCPQGGCPLSGELIIPSGEFSAGTHTLEITATDGVSLPKTEPLNITLEPPPPSVTLSGTMTEEVSLGTALSHYTLILNASAEEGTGISQPGRSTIATEVTIDGKRVVFGEASCTTESCPITREWILRSGEFAAGPHNVIVTATDRYGRTTIKKLTVTLNPPAPTVSLSGTMTEQATLGTTLPRYVLKVDASAQEGNGAISTPTYSEDLGGEGSGSGHLAEPDATATDAAGNVWVADAGHDRVQEFNAKGEFLQQFGAAGAGPGQFTSMHGLTISPAGNLYVATASRVQEFNPKGEYIRQWGASGTGTGQFEMLAGLAIDPEGHVWTVEPEGGTSFKPRLQEFSAEGTFVKAIEVAPGAGGGQLRRPEALAIDSSGDIWVADTTNNRIEEFNAKGEYLRQAGAAGSEAGQLSTPRGLAVDAAGDVWVADTGNNRVEEFGPGGNYLSQFGRSGDNGGQFSGPKGLAVDSKGNIWVADTANDRIEEVTPGEYVRQVGGEGSGSGHLAEPDATATDAAGNVWVADAGHDRVQEFNAKGEFLQQFGAAGAGPGQFTSMHGLTISPAGNLYVATASRVQEFNPKGEYIRQWGASGTGTGQFEMLAGLAIDPEGHVWTVEPEGGTSFKPRLQEFSAEGTFVKAIEVAPGAGGGQLRRPEALAIDSSGDIWVADTTNNRIEEFNAKGEYLRQAGAAGSEAGQLSTPRGLAVDAAGDVWVADTGNNRVEEFGPGGNYLSQFGRSGDNGGQFSAPKGLAMDAEVGIWIADTGNDRIQRWNVPATRSTVKTEVTLDGKAVDSGEASCPTESCPITREWILPASAGLIGKHTVVVKATDRDGSWTSKTRTIEIRPDTTKPSLEIGGELSEAPEGWVQQESYGFNATASDPNGYGVTSVALKIDGNTVASSPQSCLEGACTDSLHAPVDMVPYEGGEHRAEVVAVDGAGNAVAQSWIINVDPEGHVTAEEATATLEAAENTGVPPVIGEYGEEEPVDGAVEGLGLETTASGYEAVGSEAPMSFSDETEGTMTILIPTESEIYPCESAAEEEEGCVHQVGDVSGAGQPVEITPIDTEVQGSMPYSLIEENAAVAPNSQPGVDQIVRPLDDGGMIFEAIREESAPREYSYEIHLEEEQFLRPVDAQHAEVYYAEGDQPAFGITAEPAHDAVGTAVPTTLSVTGRDVITLTVHLNEGPGGQPFVYPVVAGTGWEGGFTTIVVEMNNPTPPPEESGGTVGEACEEECVAEEEVQGTINIMTMSPPIGDPERRFKFTHCYPHKIKDGGVTTPPFLKIPVGEDKKYESFPEAVTHCNDPENGGIFWAVSVHGHFHYEPNKWVWVKNFSNEWCTAWGEQAHFFTKAHCKMRLNEAPQGPEQKVHGPITMIGEWQIPVEASDVGVQFREECFTTVGKIFPVAGKGTYEEKFENSREFVIPEQQECNWR